MNITIVVIFLLVYFLYFTVIKDGSLFFWIIASKDPEYTYQKLLKDEAWVIDDGLKKLKINKSKYSPPYSLKIPSLGMKVQFYGELEKYRASQKRIEEEYYKNNPNSFVKKIEITSHFLMITFMLYCLVSFTNLIFRSWGIFL